jgi:hypothetical protein
MNYGEVMRKLEGISGINAVRNGSTGRVRAIDFVIYGLERPTGTSNFVFGRFGVDYKNGLIRLPRVKKDVVSIDMLKERIYTSIPDVFHNDVSVRFEPEVSLDNSYHYPHIEIHGDAKSSIEIVKAISQNYEL